MNKVKDSLANFCKRAVEMFAMGGAIVFIGLFFGALFAFLKQFLSFLKTGEWPMSLANFLINLSSDPHFQNAMIEHLTFNYPNFKGIEKILNWFTEINASLSLLMIAIIWILCTTALYKMLIEVCEQKNADN